MVHATVGVPVPCADGEGSGVGPSPLAAPSPGIHVGTITVAQSATNNRRRARVALTSSTRSCLPRHQPRVRSRCGDVAVAHTLRSTLTNLRAVPRGRLERSRATSVRRGRPADASKRRFLSNHAGRRHESTLPEARRSGQGTWKAAGFFLGVNLLSHSRLWRWAHRLLQYFCDPGVHFRIWVLSMISPSLQNLYSRFQAGAKVPAIALREVPAHQQPGPKAYPAGPSGRRL